jgi:site-specific DNA-methyltransferase (adenine-specific)
MLNTIILGDCFDILPSIPDKSVDMILCDLPYGTTDCKWDSVLDMDKLWKEYKRIIKDKRVIVLTASQPFSSRLVSSNFEMFKYEWVWDKKIPSGMSYARFQPMRQHENILVFSKGAPVYYPQKIMRDKPITAGGFTKGDGINHRRTQEFKALKKTYHDKNPTTILTFDKIRKDSLHPAQKPVPLFEYLIKTYTNEGEVVLDNCIGSGTTAIAAINTGRNFIGMENNPGYWKVADSRVKERMK